MIQGTEEWKAARLGKLTASRISKALARTKTGWGASRANLRAELVCERLTGQQQDTYCNAAMQWGTDQEPAARAAYEFYRDVDVVTVGFLEHPRIALSGASPDGLVGDDGLVEFKCPNTATHIETLLDGSVADEYRKQVLWQMAVTGRKWADLVSFDPRLPAEMQIHVARIERDDAAIRDLETEAEKFLAEVAATCDELLAKFSTLKAAA
jgi:putative phage-type endonuclease